MKQILPLPLKQFDLGLILPAVALVLIGLSTIQSTIVAGAESSAVLNQRLLNVQLLSVFAGLIIFIVVAYVNYHYLQYLAWFLYLLTVALLVTVLIVSDPTRGSVRWFEFGPINFQPSSFSTVILIICLAAYFNYFQDRINNWLILVVSGLIILIPVGLLLLEPDLGSAVVVLGLWFVMLHFTPIKKSRLITLYLAIITLIPLLWFIMADYQRSRIFSFLDPTQDPLGAGYNLIQSIIAVGSGGIGGLGWGRGTQSHLQFLPEQHTDFIFATFAEEQGFIGALAVISLYALIVWRIYSIVQTSRDYFGQLIGVGVLFWLVLHVFVNIGMNLGVAPITGIPLPLMSYGGTAMLTTWLAMGLIHSITTHQAEG